MRNANLSRLYAEAEALGLKVKARHMRPMDGGYTDNRRALLFAPFVLKENGLRPAPRGGITEVDLFSGETLVSSGIARCSALDHYCKRRGVEIALGRALGGLKGLVATDVADAARVAEVEELAAELGVTLD